MIRIVSCALLALFVAACAATPRVEPVLEGAIVNVHSSDLNDFWVPGADEVRIPGPGIRVACGHVVQQYVIDSAGQIWDVEVIEVVPDERLAKSALRAIAGLDYQPARSNPQHIPVRVRIMTTFSGSDDDCPTVDYEELAPPRPAD